MDEHKIIIKKAKKADCHIHITGSLTPGDMRSVAKLSGTDLKHFEPLEEKISFYNYDVWAAAKEITSSKVGLQKSINIILKKELADNVSHLELTINPAGMIRRGLTISEFVSVVENITGYSENIGITFKIKLGVNRKDGKESVNQVRKVFDACPKETVVAIDLNGDERQFPTKDFKKDFLKLNSAGIPTTIHAGEHFGLNQSILDAINMKPVRIAHSLVATNEDKILEKISKAGIVLEISPSSGIFTGALKNMADYPINKFIDYEIPIVFGSDDPAIFKMNLTDHLISLTKCGLDIAKILKLNELAFKHLL